MKATTYEQLEKVSNDALSGAVRPHALGFVLSALEFTLRRLRRRRHITGRELCEAVRDLAAREYGLMAKEVLEAWGVDNTEVIGRIVFALVDAGLMTKTEEDTPADFERVFNFEESFAPAAILKAARDARPRSKKKS